MPIDYRGATVEDLDLLPALTVHGSTLLSEALELSYERNFSYLPVVSSQSKRLLGYLTAEQLQSTSIKDVLSKVADYYIKFDKSRRKFQKITPNTPLEELEAFFASGQEFAVVTDDTRKFVYGVATKEDLETFVKNRPSLVQAERWGYNTNYNVHVIISVTVEVVVNNGQSGPW